MADPRGVAILQKQAALLRDTARLEEQARRSRRRAEVGGFVEGMEEMNKSLDKVQGGLNQIGSMAGTVFAGLSASIMGLGALGDGGTAVATLGVSFKLLGQAVGEGFLPYIIDAARWVQKAAAWFRGLDEATKSNIVKIALWTAGIALAVMVVAKLAAAIIGLARAITTAVTFMAMHPYVAGFLALAAAVGAVAYAFHQVGKEAREAGERMEEARKKRIQEREEREKKQEQERDRNELKAEELTKLTPEQQKRVREAMEKAPTDKGEAGRQELRKLEEEAQKKLDEEQKKQLEKLSRITQAVPDLDKIIDDTKRIFERPEGAATPEEKKVDEERWKKSAEAAEKLRKAAEEAGIKLDDIEIDRGTKITADTAGGAAEILRKKLGVGTGQASDELEAIRKARGKTGAGTDDMLMSLRGMPTPGFQTGAGYGEQLQLRSLEGEAGGSAEAKLLQQQLEAMERYLGNGGLLKDIPDIAEGIRRMTPPWRS